MRAAGHRLRQPSLASQLPCAHPTTHRVSPARKLGLALRCATSAASSITGPRAAFTSTASGFICFSLQGGSSTCVVDVPFLCKRQQQRQQQRQRARDMGSSCCC